MLYSEIIAVCYEMHTKHINTLCGQNVELLSVKLAVYKVTTGIWSVTKYTAKIFKFYSLIITDRAQYTMLRHTKFQRQYILRHYEILH